MGALSHRDFRYGQQIHEKEESLMKITKFCAAATAFMLAIAFGIFAGGNAWAKEAPKLELKMSGKEKRF
jgi:hypothetical protein